MDPAVAARLHNLYWSIGTVAFIAVGSWLVGLAAQRTVRWRNGSLALQQRAFWGYACAAPWILGFVIFVMGPALASLYYSFTDYRLGQSFEWIGLENYRILIEGVGAHGRRFIQAMHNSFYYALVGVPLQIVTALGMALLVAQPLPGMGFFRLVFYLPVILAGGPAILLAWRYMMASNGGFVNISLQNAAELLPPIGWLYRGFIFVVESFNAFYAGVTRGDPLGPLAYALPALMGAAILGWLLAGDWTEVRRTLAQRTAEIVGIVLAVLLLGQGIVAETFDLRVLLALAAIGALLMGLKASSGRSGSDAVPLAGVEPAASVGPGADPVPAPDSGPAELRTAGMQTAGRTPPRLSRARSWLLAAAVLGAALAVSLAPGQLDGGRWRALVDLTLLQSVVDGEALAGTQPDGAAESAGAAGAETTTENPATAMDRLARLTDDLPASLPSHLWLWALLALVAAAAAALGDRPRARRVTIGASLALFALLAVGSTIDGFRYFQAVAAAATEAGRPVFHFALFRQVTEAFPDANRVPLWLQSELWSKPSLVLITMWSSGTGMLIFLAALKGVPRGLYEAAQVDGATGLQRFRHVTLPMISPAMFYNVVIGLIAALQTFEAVYIIQTQQTESSLASAAYFLFVRTFRQLEIGQGAAASWILAVIIVLLTALQFRYSRWVHYGG